MLVKFRCPTKIFLGPECLIENSSELSALGKRAIIITGARSAKSSGALQDITKILDNMAISHTIFDRVEQNPSLENIFEGGQAARAFNADFVIGIGGGSPLDASKAIAILAVNQIDSKQLMNRQWTNAPLPVVAIPTTAGTGSEVTPYAILTVDWAETKLSIAADSLFPAVAFLDGRYTVNLPWDITANTTVDALTHSIEGFINNRANPFTDLLALESISIIGRLLKEIDPQQISLTEREELLYASMLGGIVISQTATGVIHSLGYQLTYFNNLPHGLANGVITKAALEFTAKADPNRVGQIVAAMGCQSLDEVGELLDKVLPAVSIKLSAEEQSKYVIKTLQAKNIVNCLKCPTEEDIYNILINSNLT